MVTSGNLNTYFRMKKITFSLMSLLVTQGPLIAQQVSPETPSGSSASDYSFVVSGKVTAFELCNTEICVRGEDGKFKTIPFSSNSSDKTIKATSEESETFLVFYPKGQMGVQSERRILRNRILLDVGSSADLESLRTRFGLESAEPLAAGSRFAVVEASSPEEVLGLLPLLSNDPAIRAAEPLLAKERLVRVAEDADPDDIITPNDPFYSPGVNRNYQWYLRNEGVNSGQEGIDICFPTALNRIEPFESGEGIRVAIVDDALFNLHDEFTRLVQDPDDEDELIVETNAGGPHLNLVNAAGDSPFGPFNVSSPAAVQVHGTNVAGLIGARGNDEFGITGVAPGVELSGVRLLGGGIVDAAQEAAAFSFSTDIVDISNNSWGPSDETIAFDGPEEIAEQALEDGALMGRGGLGLIYVFSGGNGGVIGDNSNYDGYANSIYTIAVGGISDSGRRAGFSERGANLVVSAPTGGGDQDIVTTSFAFSVNQDGNNAGASTFIPNPGNPLAMPPVLPLPGFSGTSASAPLVSGTVALMLQQNPNLGWRDVQDILIRTATMNDPTNPEWQENGAGRAAVLDDAGNVVEEAVPGIFFNPQYGSGLLNATEAVEMARRRGADEILGESESQFVSQLFSANNSRPGFPDGAIPDNENGSRIVTFDFSDQDNLNAEHVLLRATIISERRSDLEIVLISPSGTQSILQEVNLNNDEQSISGWTFMSVQHWGENTNGVWQLRITDTVTGNVSSINDVTLLLLGTEDPDEAAEAVPVLLSSPSLVVNAQETFNYFIEVADGVSVVVGDLPDGVIFDPETNVITGSFPEADFLSIPIGLTSITGASVQTNLSVVVRPTAAALGSAIGIPSFPASSGGDRPWEFEFTQTTDIADAVGTRAAARSALGLADSEQSILGFNSLPQGVLIFDWSVDSQAGSDRLWFNRGGSIPQTWDAFITGNIGFQPVAVVLPDASNTIQWIYSKDAPDPLGGPSSAGADRGLVDNLRLVSLERFRESLEDAVGLEGIDVELTSRTSFFPIQNPLPAGGEVLRASGIGDGQSVDLTGFVQGPGLFEYSAFISSADTDVFEFLVNGAVVNTLSGQTAGGVAQDFEERITNPGLNLVTLRYRKDFAGSDREDTVLLDNIRFVQDGSLTALLDANGLTLSSIMDDSDGDGFRNITELALGGLANDGAVPKGAPTFVDADGQKFIEFGRLADSDAFDYELQKSDNLSEWTEIEGLVLDRQEGDLDYYRAPVIITEGEPRAQYRIWVETSQPSN